MSNEQKDWEDDLPNHINAELIDMVKHYQAVAIDLQTELAALKRDVRKFFVYFDKMNDANDGIDCPEWSSIEKYKYKRKKVEALLKGGE